MMYLSLLYRNVKQNDIRGARRLKFLFHLKRPLFKGLVWTYYFNKSYTVKKLSVTNFRKTMKNKTRKKVYNGLRSGGTKSFYTSDLHTSVGGVQYKKQFLTQMKGRPVKICGWTRNPHWIVGTPMIRDLLMIDCLKYYFPQKWKPEWIYFFHMYKTAKISFI